MWLDGAGPAWWLRGRSLDGTRHMVRIWVHADVQHVLSISINYLSYVKLSGSINLPTDRAHELNNIVNLITRTCPATLACSPVA